jgi:hypothetical protein
MSVDSLQNSIKRRLTMQVGDIRILTSRLPYSLLCSHNTIVPKFIEVEIFEQKDDIPGEFSGKPQGSGFLAKGSDGYNYGHNYSSYNESFSDTCWSRHMGNENFLKLSEFEKSKLVKDYLWSEVTHFQCPALPKFATSFRRHLTWCEKHQNLHYIDELCFYCKHIVDLRREVIMNMTDHKWLGWYD